MIRAIAPGKDGPVVILGVTRENISRLMVGYPVAVKLSEFGPGVEHLGGDPSKITFSILYGEQHENIVEQLAEAGIEMPEDAAHVAREMDRRLAEEDAERGT
jgi:hypothetical protein